MDQAIFLDKDGTLVENVPYNVDPALIRFYPDAFTSLRQLHQAGYRLFIVTNQSGVARGYFPEVALKVVEIYLQQQFAIAGIPLAGFYYCPHHPEGTQPRYVQHCLCRKPRPGLLLQAAAKHRIDLSRSWMVGDILNDVEAGNRAGCRTILVNNGNETEWQLSDGRHPDYIVSTLLEAANVIAPLPVPSY